MPAVPSERFCAKCDRWSISLEDYKVEERRFREAFREALRQAARALIEVRRALVRAQDELREERNSRYHVGVDLGHDPHVNVQVGQLKREVERLRDELDKARMGQLDEYLDNENTTLKNQVARLIQELKYAREAASGAAHARQVHQRIRGLEAELADLRSGSAVAGLRHRINQLEVELQMERGRNRPRSGGSRMMARIPEALWKKLMLLSHPDKHDNDKTSNEVTRWLIENRP